MNRISKWRAGALAVAVLAGAAVALPSPSGAQAGRPLDLFFVDVEGGAATLMVTPAGESILVDSGWPRQDGRDAKRIEHVARYVAGVQQIDHYVTTHWHTDHYGGIEYLSKLMPVKHYWDHGVPAATEDGSKDFEILMPAYKRASGGKSHQVKPGDTLPLRQVGAPLGLKVVAADAKVVGEGSETVPTSCQKHVPAPVADDSDNKRSVSLLLSAGKFGFLNCGDLTWDIEHKLACPKNRVGQVDLWQVTHHGWEASGNPALVEAMQPKVAMMVNGARKGASPRTVKMLKKAPSVEAIYQLHRAVGNSAEDNTTPERIANMEENCKGEFMRVQLSPAGDRYTVYKGADKQLQTFRVR
jgi:beta-lactamase superfamily II metal-dependent hydrolase